MRMKPPTAENRVNQDVRVNLGFGLRPQIRIYRQNIEWRRVMSNFAVSESQDRQREQRHDILMIAFGLRCAPVSFETN